MSVHHSEEIRCQFIILRKSGVSSSFLPEKTNRHRISAAENQRPLAPQQNLYFWEEIRCQGRKSGVGGNPVSVHHSCPKRRTDTGFPRKDELTPDFRGRESAAPRAATELVFLAAITRTRCVTVGSRVRFGGRRHSRVRPRRGAALRFEVALFRRVWAQRGGASSFLRIWAK